MGSGEAFDPFRRGKFSLEIRDKEVLLQCSWRNKCWEPKKQGEIPSLREELRSLLEFSSSESNSMPKNGP
jgi:hypothetical protein